MWCMLYEGYGVSEVYQLWSTEYGVYGAYEVYQAQEVYEACEVYEAYDLYGLYEVYAVYDLYAPFKEDGDLRGCRRDHSTQLILLMSANSIFY